MVHRVIMSSNCLGEGISRSDLVAESSASTVKRDGSIVITSLPAETWIGLDCCICWRIGVTATRDERWGVVVNGGFARSVKSAAKSGSDFSLGRYPIGTQRAPYPVQGGWACGGDERAGCWSGRWRGRMRRVVGRSRAVGRT